MTYLMFRITYTTRSESQLELDLSVDTLTLRRVIKTGSRITTVAPFYVR